MTDSLSQTSQLCNVYDVHLTRSMVVSGADFRSSAIGVL
jgi:hypothetical protein